MLELRRLAMLLMGVVVLGAAPAGAQEAPKPAAPANGEELVQLDFDNVELSVVIDTIAQLTGKNFIYDDRVRGQVTIVSPTRISVNQAYAVFESVLQVKGFTTVETPGGVIKVIPIREAKESSIETIRGRTPISDRFITRLIPLRFIDAEDITNTLKPLVSKDASMVAYPPTNTVILTDSASNIRRILDILGSIDVETYKQEITVLQLRHADASTLAQQVSEIYGAEITGAPSAPARRARARRAAAQPTTPEESPVRIVTDERTNSLIVLAARQQIEAIRELVARLDIPVTGFGRIHVYYLRNADAEELAETLNALITGQPSAAAARGAQQTTPQALRAAVTELAEGITVTSDPGTNALVIQSSKEGFDTLKQVIARLDIPRPQVLVEALIMEVDVSDNQDLGFNGIARIFRGNTDYAIGSLTTVPRPGFPGVRPGTPTQTDPDPPDLPDFGDDIGTLANRVLDNLIAAASRSTLRTDASGALTGSLIQGIIVASATNSNTDILSAPHILTTDNEEAEIKVGANIPIITSRVESAAGITTAGNELATSVNVERQDIGVTLRVTPQISEGNNVRLDIFQEITDINEALSTETGDPEDVGVSLSNRRVENTVVVADGETVVIGGLISDDFADIVNKVPWLGDIPFLGWAFKSTSRSLVKTNLLIFLTPHIVRDPDDLEHETIRKREEYRERSLEGRILSESEEEEMEARRERARALGIESYSGRYPKGGFLKAHEDRYPLERMREIEERQSEDRQREDETRAAPATRYSVLAGVFGDEAVAADTLTQLLDAGYEGTLVSGESGGTLLFEVRLGPFAELEEAEQAAEVARQAFGLSPSLMLEEQP